MGYPVKLVVDHINDKPIHLQLDHAIVDFPVLAGLESDGICRFAGHVQGSLTAMREYDHLRVSGDVSVPALLACSRCLAEFEARISSRFTILFRKADPKAVADEEETELGEQDLVCATYSGDEIDISYEIGEQLAMELPIKPLCDEGCRGLCPSCGADLNQAPCGCDRGGFNFKFSALKDFKVRQ